jgi:hypothetical protein
VFEGIEIGEGLAEDVDDFVDLGAVEVKLGVAVGHRVDGFVFFQAIALEAEALDELLDLGHEDEVDVFLAEVALALRTVDGTVLRTFDQFKNKLSLASGTLKNLG